MSVMVYKKSSVKPDADSASRPHTGIVRVERFAPYFLWCGEVAATYEAVDHSTSMDEVSEEFLGGSKDEWWIQRVLEFSSLETYYLALDAIKTHELAGEVEQWAKDNQINFYNKIIDAQTKEVIQDWLLTH